MSEFREYLESLAKRFPTKHAFAEALGITPGRLSRVLGGEHSLDVLNCLKVAKLTGESPTRVLRAAGKSEIAELIESLYGPGREPISPVDRELLDDWHAISQIARQSLRVVLHDLPKNKPAVKKRGAA